MAQVITRPGNWTVPYSIELGATDELTPSSVFAHFNGAAASGAFLPCVTYYTQDGLVFARAFPADDVAAGASADVSWFPGLAQSPTGASPVDADEYVLLDEQTVPFLLTPTISFASIDQSYRHLVLYLSVGNGGAVAVNPASVRIAVNGGLTTCNYRSFTNYTVRSSSVTSVASFIEMFEVASPGPSGAGNYTFGQLVLVFPYYSRTGQCATCHWTGSCETVVVTGAGDTGFGIAPPNGPVTDLDFTLSGGSSVNFTVGSRISMYGVL